MKLDNYYLKKIRVTMIVIGNYLVFLLCTIITFFVLFCSFNLFSVRMAFLMAIFRIQIEFALAKERAGILAYSL